MGQTTGCAKWCRFGGPAAAVLVALAFAGCGGASASSTGSPIAASVSSDPSAGVVATIATDTAWVHEASGTAYPGNLAGFHFDSSHCYDAAAQDCSANYIDPRGSNVTMYVYPVAGRYPGAADPVEAEFQQAARAIDLRSQPAVSSGVWRTQAGDFPTRLLSGETVVPLGEARSMSEALLVMSQEGRDTTGASIVMQGPDEFYVVAPRATYLVLTRVGPWYVKWRYTRRGAAGPDQGELAAFVRGAPVPRVR